MKYKRIVDTVMLLLLLFLMAFPLTEQKIHEILGIMMLICNVVHHALNWKWYTSLLKGQYSAFRKLSIAINLLLLLDILLILLSGFTMSRLLPFLSFMSVSMARKLHMVFTYWGFILMVIHVGVHLETILAPIKKRFKEKSTVTWMLISYFPYLIAIYGILMFMKYQWIDYLLMLNSFVYFDDSIGLFQMLFDYCSIFILFLIITNRIGAGFKQRKAREEK